MLKIDKKRIKLLKNIGFFIIFIFINIMFLVWAKMSTIQLGYKLTERHKNFKDMQLETQKLKIMTSSLKSQERIQTISYSKFNLVYPSKDKIIIIKAKK